MSTLRPSHWNIHRSRCGPAVRGPCRNIDGQLLGSILRNKIRDKRFLRYEIASQININHGLNFVSKQMLVQRTDRIVAPPYPV